MTVSPAGGRASAGSAALVASPGAPRITCALGVAVGLGARSPAAPSSLHPTMRATVPMASSTATLRIGDRPLSRALARARDAAGVRLCTAYARVVLRAWRSAVRLRARG